VRTVSEFSYCSRRSDMVAGVRKGIWRRGCWLARRRLVRQSRKEEAPAIDGSGGAGPRSRGDTYGPGGNPVLTRRWAVNGGCLMPVPATRPPLTGCRCPCPPLAHPSQGEGARARRSPTPHRV
jgi:hypothetical protein